MNSHKHPRLLFYGAMVNFLYGAAKACNASGFAVEYLTEESDTFPAHHPFWLDVCHQFTQEDYQLFADSRQEFLARVNWVAPEFVRSEYYDTHAFARRSVFNPLKRYIYNKFYSGERVKRLCSIFQSYDCIVVCGANAVIEAYLSGKPYVVFVYGADLRLYLGVDPPPIAFRARVSYEMYRILLKDAYDNANAIISNPPLSIYASGAKNITHCEKVFCHNNAYDIVYPIVSLDKEYSLGIELSCDKINILIPSRIDFYWKGQDIFLTALSRSPYRDRFHIYLLQWGNHQHEAHQLVERLQLADVVTFLPFFATRLLLLALYDKFDLVVDEFYIGTYGTAALEAMSRRKAVVTYIDKGMFSCEDHIPPCLSLRTQDEFLRMFEQICTGEIDLKEIGEAAYAWQQRNSSASAFTKNLLDVLNHSGIIK